MKCSEIE